MGKFLEKIYRLGTEQARFMDIHLIILAILKFIEFSQLNIVALEIYYINSNGDSTIEFMHNI